MGELVVKSVTEEREEEGVGAIRWERLLPRMCVSVLLVEADDSTRQIIAALLRKCSYRVAAVADGSEAWETLKEKHQNIDLVLTEVELPSVSGFGLLTMIMEHQTFKNIPVIMMSSHDSINMVFNCMLKGASDFLIKPIRKNELRNLWQHVWRRHSSNGGSCGTHEHQDEILAQQKYEASFENNAASNHSSDCVTCVQKNRECSEKGSGTQSSCTRPDMEAESPYMQNMQEHKQPNCRSPFINLTRVDQDEGCDKLDGDLLMRESEAEGKSIRLGPVVAPCGQAINSCDHILGKKCADAGVMALEYVIPVGGMEDTSITCEIGEQNFDQTKPSREVIDLLGTIDNQSQLRDGRKNSIAVGGGVSNNAEIVVDGKDHIYKPLLELSLRSYQPTSSDNLENDKCNMLNHSNSSAFSRYKSRMSLVPISTSNNFRSDFKNYFGDTHRYLPNQGLSNINTSQCNGVTLNMDWEDTCTPAVGLPNQDGTGVQCSGLGVLPFPVPISSITYNNLCTGSGSVMQSTHSSPQMWSPNPATQEAIHVKLSMPSDPETLNSEKSLRRRVQNARKPIYQAEKEQVQNMESLEEQRHASSITGQSGSNSICDGSRSHLNSSGCGSVCNGSYGNLTAINVARTTAESGNDDGLFTRDGIKLTGLHCSRKAAVTKFQLKRNDRCYGKRVRYQSRKRLAEQRPRVKGQFVRQVQPDPQSMEADSYCWDSRGTVASVKNFC